MGQIEVHSPVFERENLLKQAREGVEVISQSFQFLKEELVFLMGRSSPVLSRQASRKMEELSSLYSQSLPRINSAIGVLHKWEESLDKEDIPLDRLRELNSTLRDIADTLVGTLSEIQRNYEIREDPKTGERILVEFKGERQTPTQPESTNALEELKKISNSPHPDKIRIPKDLMETQVHSVGDTLQYIKDQKTREEIQRLQDKGQLLAGTLEGLSGGGAYLKSFTIALSQTLNEQSKYYKTEEDLSGVPKDLIPDIFGDGVEVQRKDNPSLPVKVRKDGGIDLQKESRKFPYILVSYEDLARKMKGEGKTPGGTDISYIRDYISDLSGKQYLLSNGIDHRTGQVLIIGVPFLVKELTIYKGKEGKGIKEVGCLLRLSPQFSKSVRKYTLLRADTIQRIGGGRQRDITMNLLDLLLYVRGTERGEEAVWRKNKEDLLSQIATSKRYIKHKGERERDFQEAVQKVKDSLLILDYREYSTYSGVVSEFKFNPNYSKKDTEETTPPDVQDHTSQGDTSGEK